LSRRKVWRMVEAVADRGAVSVVDTDLLIVGAGPAGLFGAYYAGFRGMSVTLVDSLHELGGQVSALYPEKAILDVAGFVSVKGRELVEQLVEQAASAKPKYHLGRTASSLVCDDESATTGATSSAPTRPPSTPCSPAAPR
jgi:ferredoxin/flavodoxin---NADP+ reductase